MIPLYIQVVLLVQTLTAEGVRPQQVPVPDEKSLQNSFEPRLFDAFMLNHEFDTFRAHVFENADRVHAFIVVETAFTHKIRLKTPEEMGVKRFIDKVSKAELSSFIESQSQPHLKSNQELGTVKQFLDKFRTENPSLPTIHYVEASVSSIRDKDGHLMSGWIAENIGRDHILRGFNELGGKDQDLIMVADADEIFNGRCWSKLGGHNLSKEIVHFTASPAKSFKHSFKCHMERMWWKGPAITSGKVLREIGAQNVRESSNEGGCEDRDRANFSEDNPFKFACTTNDNERSFVRPEEGCSWHLSNFGGAEAAMRKFENNIDGPADANTTAADIDSIRDRMNRCEMEQTFFSYEIDTRQYYERHDNPAEMQFPKIPWYVSTHRSEFENFFYA